MIGLDTNVLARYYIADADSATQREAARQLVEAGDALMVCKTVLLEFEWVMRGYYEFGKADIVRVLRHLIDMPHVTVEDRQTVESALSNYQAGFDFADALHHASYRDCVSMASFDDRGFARRAKRLGLQPSVKIPR